MFNSSQFAAASAKNDRSERLTLIHRHTADTRRVTARLTDQRLIAPPRFLAGEQLELVVGNWDSTELQPNYSGQEENTALKSSPEQAVVRCNQWQFYKLAYHLKPNSRLVIEGKPSAITGPEGEPMLAVECSRIEIERPRRILALSRLGFCWTVIAGLTLLLQLVAPRLMPPGMVLLTTLLGMGRLVEQTGLSIPDSLKPRLKSWLVKLLTGFGVLVAIWLFVQFSYYSTPRFR